MTRLTVKHNAREMRWEAVTAFGAVEYHADTRRECDAYAGAENQRMRNDAPPADDKRIGLGKPGLPF